MKSLIKNNCCCYEKLLTKERSQKQILIEITKPYIKINDIQTIRSRYHTTKNTCRNLSVDSKGNMNQTMSSLAYFKSKINNNIDSNRFPIDVQGDLKNTTRKQRITNLSFHCQAISKFTQLQAINCYKQVSRQKNNIQKIKITCKNNSVNQSPLITLRGKTESFPQNAYYKTSQQTRRHSNKNDNNKNQKQLSNKNSNASQIYQNQPTKQRSKSLYHYKYGVKSNSVSLQQDKAEEDHVKSKQQLCNSTTIYNSKNISVSKLNMDQLSLQTTKQLNFSNDFISSQGKYDKTIIKTDRHRQRQYLKIKEKQWKGKEKQYKIEYKRYDLKQHQSNSNEAYLNQFSEIKNQNIEHPMQSQTYLNSFRLNQDQQKCQSNSSADKNPYLSVHQKVNNIFTNKIDDKLSFPLNQQNKFNSIKYIKSQTPKFAFTPTNTTVSISPINFESKMISIQPNHNIEDEVQNFKTQLKQLKNEQIQLRTRLDQQKQLFQQQWVGLTKKKQYFQFIQKERQQDLSFIRYSLQQKAYQVHQRQF